MLIVVQIGSTNRDTLGSTPSLFSAEDRVTGRVAAELLVNSAITTAGAIALKTLRGFIPLTKRNNGNTMKNWIAFPARITAVYLPSEPTIIPPLSCPTSWAEKATIPIGNVQMRALIKVKKSSCSPEIPFTTTLFPSVSGIHASANPTAMAISKIERTFPDRNGAITLLGMTETICS